jgi:tetratricopeptide (TPR) repeat protein
MKRLEAALLLAIVLLALAAHANALGNAFVLDDVPLIERNPRIRSLGQIPELFGGNYWGPQKNAGLYRPLVLTSFALNYAAGGLRTAGYAVVNLALHAAVCAVLFALARSLGASPAAAGATGLLFAVHPVHTEAVVGLVGRAETLAALFVLTTLLLHRGVARVRSGAWPRRLAAAACLLLGLLSKESAVTGIGLLLAMDLLLPSPGPAGGALRLRERWRDHGLYLLVLVVYLAARTYALGSVAPEVEVRPLDNPLAAQSGPTALGNLYGPGPLERVLTPFAALAQYARLLVWPARLCADYSLRQIPLVSSPLDPGFLVGAAAAGGVLLGSLALRRREPRIAFGLLFLALALSLTSNIGLVIGTILAERLLYLPSAGALLAAALAWDRLRARVPRAARAGLVAGLVLLVVAGALRTWQRNRDWRDAGTLWESGVAACPDSAKAHGNLGNELRKTAQRLHLLGRAEEAAPYFRRSEAHLRRALELYPELSQAMAALGTLLTMERRFDEAFELYARAVRVDADLVIAYHDWGIALTRKADSLGGEAARALYREAVAMHTKVLELRPDDVDSLYLRGRLYHMHLGQAEAAARDFREVLRLAPQHPQRETMSAILERRTEGA